MWTTGRTRRGRSRYGPAEAWTGQVVATFGGSPHFLACSPRTRFWVCLLGPVSSDEAGNHDPP